MSSDPPSIATAVCVRLLPRVPESTALVAAFRADACPWLLDSALALPSRGRFSFAGASPYAVLRTFGRVSTLDCVRAVRPDFTLGLQRFEGDPLELLRRLLPSAPVCFAGDDASELPFVGGCVGYFGYEFAEQLEVVRFTGRDDLALPDQVQLFVDRLIAFDHEAGRAFAVGLGFADVTDAAAAVRRSEEACVEVAARAARVPQTSLAAEDRAASLLCSGPAVIPAGVEALFDERRYVEAVKGIGCRIAAGDLYQANLTHRMEMPIGARAPFALYEQLRRTNPAPFAAYLELPEVAILSSSPERFLRADALGHVESRPIKGTRPRGAGPEEDARLEQELAASEKDRAENLMIVDLVRNDLGRVCETGSVAVPQLRAIERYATVFQMVSSVTGRLRADCDALDLVRACFPPGSMTGAPKIAAMRLLDSIEPVRRGIYSGALGYLDVRGGLDLSVVIRTLLVKDGRAYVHVGGGIVADSDPVSEYRETLDKARALFAVLSNAGEALVV